MSIQKSEQIPMIFSDTCSLGFFLLLLLLLLLMMMMMMMMFSQAGSHANSVENSVLDHHPSTLLEEAPYPAMDQQINETTSE